MKANAQEKLFFNQHTAQYNHERRNDDEVEYTRTDAFIEKACNVLAKMVWEITYEDLEGDSVQHYDKMEFIDEFRKYMEGE